jgi:adenosylmethionine-8-amino-7-oxononanoate aminotransferase
MFGVTWADVTPDVMCVGKALTGGYLTLAALLTTDRVASAITRSPQRALMHGPTFMANPLACAVALASLSFLPQEHERVREIGRELAHSLAPATELESVRDVRVLGAVGVIQLREQVNVQRVTRAALTNGIWLRPFRDLVYAMPPYVAASDEIAMIGRAMTLAVAEVHG